MNPFQHATSRRDSHSILAHDQKIDDACTAVGSSGFSIRRRWWIGCGIVATALSWFCFPFLVLEVLGVSEWSSQPIRLLLAIFVFLFVFVGMPIVIFEIAFQLVARPWYKKHSSELMAKERSQVEEH